MYFKRNIDHYLLEWTSCARYSPCLRPYPQGGTHHCRPLAFAPRHVYIKHIGEDGKWVKQDIENETKE